MQIRAHLAVSADGYVTTPGGWPAQTADPAFVPGRSHGVPEFLEGCEAGLDVFVLCSERPHGTPEHVVSDGDPARLLERIRAATGEATSTWSAARARSRPSARSGRSTGSTWACCRCCSATGCG